jgi:hypothetical protein
VRSAGVCCSRHWFSAAATGAQAAAGHQSADSEGALLLNILVDIVLLCIDVGTGQ